MIGIFENGKYTGYSTNEFETDNKNITMKELSNEEIIKYENVKNNSIKELQDLYSWFKEYDKQVIEYNRCIRLNIKYDKDIDELDRQAEIKAKRINYLNNN